MNPIYGAVKDRWRPDDPKHRPAAIPLPDLVDNSAFLPPVQSQGINGACVGESFSEQMSARAKKMAVYSEPFSPKWIWNGARFMEGCLRTNCGVQPGDAADWIEQRGLLLDHFWPLNPMFFDPAPPRAADFPEAAKYPIDGHFRVTGNQDSICSAISQHDFLSIGTPWFPQWENVGLDGILQSPQKGWYLPPNNWHETLLYGYDRKRSLYFGMNSWDIIWGKFGFFLMPFEAFNRFADYGGWDAWYLTVNKWPVEPKPPCWLKSLLK